MKTKSILKKTKRSNHPKVKDTLDQLAEKKTKIVPVGNVENGRQKVLLVPKVVYSRDVIESVFHSVAHIIALRDAQYRLKGTEFFSSALEREMDRISSVKLMPLFRQNPAADMSEVSMKMADIFSAACWYMYQLTLQPQQVQDRFEREYKNLLISCGVTLRE